MLKEFASSKSEMHIYFRAEGVSLFPLVVYDF
jgi:hypothetical protein